MWLVNGIFHFIRSTQTVSKVVTPFSTPISSFESSCSPTWRLVRSKNIENSSHS